MPATRRKPVQLFSRMTEARRTAQALKIQAKLRRIRDLRATRTQPPALRPVLDVSLESVLHLAERLWCHSDEPTQVKVAAEAVLLAGLKSVLLTDADDQGVVHHRRDVGDLAGVDPIASGVGGSDGGSGLRQLKAGILGKHSHGSVPSLEGSDKSAGAVRTRASRRLSSGKTRGGQ